MGQAHELGRKMLSIRDASFLGSVCRAGIDADQRGKLSIGAKCLVSREGFADHGCELKPDRILFGQVSEVHAYVHVQCSGPWQRHAVGHKGLDPHL